MTKFNPEESVLNAWAINQRVLLKLLDAIPNEALTITLFRKGSRTVADQLMHLHSVRLMWMTAGDKKAAAGKNAMPEELTGEVIKKSLESSYSNIDNLIRSSFQNNGKVKGAGMDVITFVSYLISHESHHRGNILLTLKLSDFPISKERSYSFWDWKKQ